MSLSPTFDRYDNVLLDLDGCVRVGEHATERAGEAVAALRAAGKGIAFVTNDTRLGHEEVVQQLWGLGLQASLQDVVTVGGTLQFVLASQAEWRTAFVIGWPAIHNHVLAAGLRILNHTDLDTRSDVVVVAHHEGFDYAELRTATRAVLGGAALVGLNRDPTFPTDDGIEPGSGAVLAAVETATGRTAVTLGKPEPDLFRTAIDRLGPGAALMVGDRLDADVGGAAAAGLDAALVLTGVTSREEADAARDEHPNLVAVADSLGALVLGGSVEAGRFPS